MTLLVLYLFGTVITLIGCLFTCFPEIESDYRLYNKSNFVYYFFRSLVAALLWPIITFAVLFSALIV